VCEEVSSSSSPPSTSNLRTEPDGRARTVAEPALFIQLALAVGALASIANRVGAV
jgi:hypothetical protein